MAVHTDSDSPPGFAVRHKDWETGGGTSIAAAVLKTGQTTQYSSELDDGYYQKGVAKAYTVLTTGQYQGTTNVDLVHYTASTIAFVSATKKITDSASGLAIFKTGDVIVVTGSVSNNGVYTVATGGVAGEIVVSEVLADEAAGASVSIAKRESKSNNCVLDNNTGLMWLRDASNYPAKMGVASDGKMPWTGQLYDIFAYCAACNAAVVGGYSDWRVANLNELQTLWIAEGAEYMDTTAFPHLSNVSFLHSSTTVSGNEYAHYFLFSASYHMGATEKTTAYRVILVRGPAE